MVVRCMPNYGHGGPHGTPFITIFGIYVSTQIPNIEYFELYEVTFIYIYTYMVITGVENWSPDMIPVAFDGKFDEKKDDIPPGICRPRILQMIQY